ncbi:MAG: hypothetical protein ACREVL_19570, partial [Solimonas sp.]
MELGNPDGCRQLRASASAAESGSKEKSRLAAAVSARQASMARLVRRLHVRIEEQLLHVFLAEAVL